MLSGKHLSQEMRGIIVRSCIEFKNILSKEDLYEKLVRLFKKLRLEALITMSAPLVGEIDIQEEWTNWKSTHDKTYESSEEEQRRFAIFEGNVKDIQDHNRRFEAGQETYSKSLNKFADHTPEEVPKGLLYQRR